MPSITTPPTSPPAVVIRAAAEHNRRAGHENAGPLSLERGFTPARPPELRFPPTHRAWDDVARELPELPARLTLRRRLENLPALDATDLPDACLQRAATVLGILVHAYHRVEPRRSSPTPPVLDAAWRQVCSRLDRAAPNLAYLDLIVANSGLRGEPGAAVAAPAQGARLPGQGLSRRPRRHGSGCRSAVTCWT